VFDGATTAVARGKISAAAERNQPIPSHWALDAHGQPTNDPQAALAGALLPAGTLGYGLGLAIALLTGGLLGGVSDDQLPSFLNPPHQPVPTSVLLIGIDPDAMGGLAHLYQHGQAFVERIVASRGNPRIPGQRRNLPATSITLDASTLSTLTALADKYHLPARYRLPSDG
jgi:(2R)-3-sulfolactate dehydrogenase (NADP+)